MPAEIEIHVEGFIDWRGMARDPEKPAALKVGYYANRSLTTAPEITHLILKVAEEAGVLVTAEVIAKLILKHLSKDKSKTVSSPEI